MADLFSTNVLTGVVNSLQTPPSFLLNTFFPIVQTEASEEIHFDVENDVMKLAPFVSPLVEGQIVTEQGYVTKTFKPAYVKPKTEWEPSKALKRTKGEPIGGILSPEQRQQLQVRDILIEHRKMIARRLEVTAAEALRLGQVTVSGEKYPQVVVSYGRDAALTITLADPNQWGDAGINPLDSLQDWADLIQQKSGAAAQAVVMDVKAWKLFRANADVKSRLDIQRTVGAMPPMLQDALKEQGGRYMGTVDSFDIWVYSGFYKNDAGTITKILPDNTVIMAGDLMGTQAYGAIQDIDANLMALPFFSKSWVTPDPSRRWIMTQSAPLLVPYRVNATLCATVA